jgi:Fur family ferric uptake transcriptional regulator
MPRLSPNEAAAFLERFRRHLREHRLPVTRQRVAVADALFASDDHPSVEEIDRRLRARGESVGTATLYRTLDLLVEGGLARVHDFGGQVRRYEPMAAAHDHLVCRRCGRVVEFGNERLERMLRMTSDELRFHYQEHRVEVHGQCADCRSRDLEPLHSGAAKGSDR